jgi:hypothetical protein
MTNDQIKLLQHNIKLTFIPEYYSLLLSSIVIAIYRVHGLLLYSAYICWVYQVLHYACSGAASNPSATGLIRRPSKVDERRG